MLYRASKNKTMIIARGRIFPFFSSFFFLFLFSFSKMYINDIYLIGRSHKCTYRAYRPLLDSIFILIPFVSFFLFRYRTRDRAARRLKARIYMSAACRKIWRNRIWKIFSVLTVESSRHGYCATTSPVSHAVNRLSTRTLRSIRHGRINRRPLAEGIRAIFPISRNMLSANEFDRYRHKYRSEYDRGTSGSSSSSIELT